MTVYQESDRDVRIREFLEGRLRLQQFGQPADGDVWNGRTACTHTCWQIVTLFVKGKRLSLDEVNARAGMPKNARAANGDPRGMRISEQKTFVDRMDLPYVLKLGLSWDQLQKYGRRGPIVYGVRYGSEPDWKGKSGADGKPNGYARKFGRTQFVGAENIRHAVLFGLSRGVTTNAGRKLRTEILRRDPNHGSGARGELPPYDVISPRQAEREYLDIQKVGGDLFAFVPKRSANL